MSDLVKILRNRPNDAPMTSERLMDESADRIEHLERVLIQAREAMRKAVSANNFRAACLCSDAPMEKIDFAENAFWSAMDKLAAIDEALNPKTIGGTSDAS